MLVYAKFELRWESLLFFSSAIWWFGVQASHDGPSGAGSLIHHPQTCRALPMLWHEGRGFYNGLCQACFLSLSGLFSPKRASWLNNPLVSVLLHQWWDLPHLHRQTPHCSCTPHRAPLGQAASGARIRILL